MRNNIQEIAVAGGFIALAILLLNPFHFWMPDMLVVAMLVVALVLFGAFAIFVLRERAADERDAAHISLAGRNAFLAGSAVLLVGIVVQGYHHTVEPWLVIALTAMVAIKVGSRIWSDRYR